MFFLHANSLCAPHLCSLLKGNHGGNSTKTRCTEAEQELPSSCCAIRTYGFRWEAHSAAFSPLFVTDGPDDPAAFEVFALFGCFLDVFGAAFAGAVSSKGKAAVMLPMKSLHSKTASTTANRRVRDCSNQAYCVY